MISKRFRKSLSILCIGLMITTGVSGCGMTGSNKNTVAVQSVSSLMGMNIAGANTYGGVVESKTTQKVQKDSDKSVKQCNVKVGDQVKPGDVLFTYDIDELNLTIETKKLEIEQIQSNLVSSRNQVTELTKERNSASANDKLSYTLEIQEIELEIQESEYNLKSKQAELEKLQKSVGETSVKAEVAGIVQSINENADGGSDYDEDYSYGGGSSSDAYMTIMETGSYQIKGTASESSINSLYLDMPVLIRSRSDRSKTWSGRISNIDTESPSQDTNQDEYYYSDDSSGESASKYAFYVDLEDTTDILMGQHVYLMPYEEGTYDDSTITLAANFFTVTEEGSWCYAASEAGTIEKREVTLSTLNEETNTYDVLSGLTLDDYIADATTAPEEGTAVVMFDSDDHTVHSQSVTGESEAVDGSGDAVDENLGDEEYYEENLDGDDEDWATDDYLDEEGNDSNGDSGDDVLDDIEIIDDGDIDPDEGEEIIDDQDANDSDVDYEDDNSGDADDAARMAPEVKNNSNSANEGGV